MTQVATDRACVGCGKAPRGDNSLCDSCNEEQQVAYRRQRNQERLRMEVAQARREMWNRQELKP